ncbi:hypothetical protein K505DRAFT_364341 [Melanomma pulvis-pyrius CBS 109.77]|uniref:Rhodopsin domain-containing protein n=1 Tax=Melanomma pulvis-pyrius CBS 109.77 TaxID=1314802 RepID=A0A6A6X2Y1_9PLEO|nr:hypothetical protein K505DRAFT_364341 [Melanomma pulvis-pyrius CBS 109.77]
MTLPTFPPGRVDESRAPILVGVASTFIVLEVTIVILRVMSRRIISARLAWDDIFIFPSLLFCLGLCALGIIETKIAGVGRHLDVLFVYDPAALVHWGKAGYAIEQLYCIAVVFPKLSILASYLRIFLDRRYRIITYVLGGVIAATGIAGVVTSLASCQPFSARYQSPEYADQHCINTLAYWRWISLPNILTDVIMLVLPLPILWGLRMSKKDRVALILIFVTGSIGIVTSVIRFSVFFNVKALATDGTYISADLAVWSLVEPGMYLLAACLPTIRPLVLKVFGRDQRSTGVSDGSTSQKFILLELRKDGQREHRSNEDGILWD